MTVGISSEAVERLVQAVAVDAVAVSATTIITLRAQAERIKELEAENGILHNEKHADAEAIASARNDALREARNIADAAMKKYAKATYSGEPVKVFKAGDDTNSHSAAKCYCAGEILIEIAALIEGDKP